MKKKQSVAKKKKIFQINVELIAYDKNVLKKKQNSWNVFRWYMVKDSKNFSTKKTQQ